MAASRERSPAPHVPPTSVAGTGDLPRGQGFRPGHYHSQGQHRRRDGLGDPGGGRRRARGGPGRGVALRPGDPRGPDRGGERGPVTASRRRILFVDNRPEFMHQPVLRLRLEGYDVDEASSGEDALGALRGSGYDLLILDAELPDSDGWEVLKSVREDPELKGQKVIVLMAEQGETGKLVLVPVDAELRRPFNMARLVETVQRVLEDEPA